jgi:Zn-dependent M16 (insulinase) family peptidase
MIRLINKKRKEIFYNPGNLIFLFNRNIKMARTLKKLNNKILRPFKILKAIRTFYYL